MPDRPYIRFATVTPTDGVRFATGPTKTYDALYIGKAGDLVVLLGDGVTTQLFAGLPVGTILPVSAAGVQATNTTADKIVALYRS